MFLESKKDLKINRKLVTKLRGFLKKLRSSRKDFHFKLAHHLCDSAGMIFAEELNLKAMAKGILGKHCLDAAWGGFLVILGWIAWKRGVYFAKVDAKGTSQYCPACDAHTPKDLSVRVHDCPECGIRTNRDVASSQLVLKRGLAAVGQIVKKSVEEAKDTKAPVKQKTQSAKNVAPRRRR